MTSQDIEEDPKLLSKLVGSGFIRLKTDLTQLANRRGLTFERTRPL